MSIKKIVKCVFLMALILVLVYWLGTRIAAGF